VRHFRYLGFLEGASLLILLLIAMPIKYWGGDPLPVRIVGSIHGFLFVVYVIFAFDVARRNQWSMKLLGVCLVLSAVPAGTFYFDRAYLSKRSI
jgi:integral membrane protein